MLKILIAVLFIAMVISLTSGFVFLMKDHAASNKRRLMWALGVRIALATALIGTIAYGIWSGQLQVGAPWSNRY
ncbi:DUF2909 domain-containing protein [Umboniibacter marinipuniceus]|uniref:DUF2909 family protein n=1 Tax=Umboniibacter marinipuniceus TaxID=569599 RepID=A0A3M0ADG9_9GAMM|nr:DUF2909 domain-containing protein [Umboniibacter marinipuniceus]RMA82164.1 DUF2909 family protein [Umboniibacter marinipuniceus]